MDPSYYNPAVETHEAMGFQPQPVQPIQPAVQGHTPQHVAARGFTQLFGLHPGMTVLLITVDSMLFGGQLATAEFIYPLAVATAFGLGIITYMAQKKWFGDDHESALLKASIVFGLTALPTSIPGFLAV
jgi:hypothetical protein